MDDSGSNPLSGILGMVVMMSVLPMILQMFQGGGGQQQYAPGADPIRLPSGSWLYPMRNPSARYGTAQNPILAPAQGPYHY